MELGINDFTNPRLRDLCRRARVLLDDRVVEKVIYANEEDGVLIKYCLDQNGKPIACSLDEFATEVCYGKVKIIDPETVDLSEVYLR